MRKLSNLMVIVAMTCITLFAAPLSTTAANEVSGIEIYYPNNRVLLLNMIEDDLKALNRDLNLPIKTFYSNLDQAKQLQLIRQNTGKNAAIVIRSVDNKRARDIIEAARERDATLIFVSNQPADPSIIRSYDKAWFVASDFFHTADMQSEMIAAYLKEHRDYDRNGNGVLDVMLLRGIKGHPHADLRSARNKETLDSLGIKYRIVDEIDCEWTYERAFAHVTEVIEKGKFPSLDIIIANNDDMALGALDAIEQSQQYESGKIDVPPIFGADGVPDALVAVRRGAMVGTVTQITLPVARVIMEICKGQTSLEVLSRIAGEESFTDRNLLLKNNVTVTRANVKEYMEKLRHL